MPRYNHHKASVKILLTGSYKAKSMKPKPNNNKPQTNESKNP